MTSPSHPAMTASPALQAFGLRSPSTAPAGSWKLARGRAVTLHDANGAVLRITHGRVWATVDGPHAGPANNRGDIVLEAGQRLTVPPGRRVVIEPWRTHTASDFRDSSDSSKSGEATATREADAVYFSWDPAPAALPLQMDAALQGGSRLQCAVVYPLRDFGLALALAARALGRLAWGVAGLFGSVGELLTAGRGRVQPCMESNPP
jgi:Protein of unknown function (DUF2917)